MSHIVKSAIQAGTSAAILAVLMVLSVEGVGNWLHSKPVSWMHWLSLLSSISLVVQVLDAMVGQRRHNKRLEEAHKANEHARQMVLTALVQAHEQGDDKKVKAMLDRCPEELKRAFKIWREEQ